MHRSDKSHCFEYDLFPLAGYSRRVQAYRHSYLSIYLFIHSGHSNCNILFNAMRMWVCSLLFYIGYEQFLGEFCHKCPVDRTTEMSIACILHGYQMTHTQRVPGSLHLSVSPSRSRLSCPLPRQPCPLRCKYVKRCMYGCMCVCECLLLLPLHLPNIYDCRPRPKCGIIIWPKQNHRN